MKQGMRILIGYDGSKASDAMLLELDRAGLPPGTEALVLRMVTPWVSYAPGNEEGIAQWPSNAARIQYERTFAEQVDLARKSVEKAAASLAGRFPDWKIRVEASAGNAAQGLLSRAAAWKADLVMVADQGRTAAGRFFFGSVSEKILRHSTAPVRLVRKVRRHKGPTRILLGYDGSRGADEAVRELTARKWAAGTQIRILAVVDLRDAGLSWLPSDSEDLAGRASAWLDRKAGEALDRLASSGLVAERRIRVGDARRLLLEEASRWRADCIFLGSRGLGGFESRMLGSVSSSVALRAGCPVEIIRRRGARRKKPQS